MTPPVIDPGTVRLVAQRLNHYAAPGMYIYIYICNVLPVSLGMDNSEVFLEMCGPPKKAQAESVLVCDPKAYGGMAVYLYLFLPPALDVYQ